MFRPHLSAKSYGVFIAILTAFARRKKAEASKKGLRISTFCETLNELRNEGDLWLAKFFFKNEPSSLMAVWDHCTCNPDYSSQGLCLPADHNPTGTQGSRPLPLQEIKMTMGEKVAGSCAKRMSWTSNGNSFDRDALSPYVNLYNNVWKATATRELSSQSVECIDYQEGILLWSSKFDIKSASGQESQVKSYSNAAWAGKPVQIRSISRFSSVWKWSLLNESPKLVLDVSFDIFLTDNPDCRSQDCASREIMIWLAATNGARPAGKQVNQSPIIVGGNSFDLWAGVVGVSVLSLIPCDPQQRYTNFRGSFVNLLKNALVPYGVRPDEYVMSVGAGIELFDGSGTFNVKRYSMILR
ncbi:hypothetical protein O181_019803 [Austropuccinia psidii MF-1]|uniref:Glycoside hydrolase family 12 protein n=1 Tax=Austropuccinia psidii MF-1 TaxID=1389203 RepID=A0A9Q3CBR8_9BASI|nr:hypothetical protein [Austropuccinia psidii MF-1]